MDWESKFSSIVRETESNLAKVKQRLGSARASSLSALTLNSGTDFSVDKRDTFLTSGTSSVYTGAVSLPIGRPASPFKHNPYMDSSAYGTEGNFGMNVMNGFPIDHSPGVAALLQERLEQQSKAIETLNRTVRRLEEEKELYYKHMKDLRDEMALLHNRISEKGVDLQTERKIESWKRDVMSEMQLLQSQLQLHNSKEENTSLNHATSSALMHEVHDIKRHVQAECDSVRRDMESLKTRLVKLELTHSSTAAENRELNRRLDRIDQSVLGIMKDSHNSTLRNFDRTQGNVDQDKEEISQLKSSVRDLHKKLENVQSTFSTNKDRDNTPRKTSLKTGRIRRRAPRPASADLLSPNTSDLDLSDTTDFGDLQSSDLFHVPKSKPFRIDQKTSAFEEELSLGDLTGTDDLLSSAFEFETEEFK